MPKAPCPSPYRCGDELAGVRRALAGGPASGPPIRSCQGARWRAAFFPAAAALIRARGGPACECCGGGGGRRGPAQARRAAAADGWVGGSCDPQMPIVYVCISTSQAGRSITNLSRSGVYLAVFCESVSWRVPVHPYHWAVRILELEGSACPSVQPRHYSI